MKHFILSFLLLCSLYATAQTTSFDDETKLLFRLKYANNNTDVSEINWKKERPVSEFTLKGENQLKYSVTLENDSTAMLSQYSQGKWIVQEKISISEWTLRHVENKAIISEFKITDFNDDGNEDLICWTHTNINGNEWVVIFLNDPTKKRLSKLWDDAGETDIWDRPVFNSEKGYISTELEASAYGTSEESIFLLDGLTAIPVSKHEQDRTSDIITDKYYIGNNGKWELNQTFTDNFRDIDFLLPAKVKDFESIDWKKEKIFQEFTLEGQGQTPLKCRITLTSPDEALLEQFINNQWIKKGNVGWFENETSYSRTESFTPSFSITDFNRDGNEDVVCWHLNDVNGNQHTTIYLNDPTTKTLVLLKNPDDDVWSAPDFDKLTDTITCNVVAGMFGVSSESTYRLDGLTAIPLLKKEFDSLHLNIETGEGRILRTYKGENGKWVLISEEKLKPEPKED